MAKDWQMVLTGSLAVGVALIFPTTKVLAQNITLDGTLGTAGTLTGPNYEIPQSVGQTVGNNLFHSFGKFNLNSNESAIFQSANNVRNILSRVTGGSPSSIDGLIRTLGNDVNFFLINPSGILFGENARLDVSSSIVTSTANAIQFGNQGFFSATNPETPSSLLTVNPSALFFNQLQGGRIENRSIAPAGDNLFGLRVLDGRSLLLVGGDIVIDRGRLNAPGGQVELVGVVGAGTVGLNVDGKNLSLSVPDDVARGDVSLTNRAWLDVKAGGGGSVTVYAKNLELTRSNISAGIRPRIGGSGVEAGDITLNATGAIRIKQASTIENAVYPNAKGNSGNIVISTLGSSFFTDSLLNTINYGQGSAGSIFVRAKDSVSLTDSGLHTSILGQGNAGSVFLQARDSVSLVNAKIVSALSRGAEGEGGSINISSTSSSLSMTNSELETTIYGKGNAGDVFLQAKDFVSITGHGVSIDTGVGPLGKGEGGDINIRADSLYINDDAQLRSAILKNDVIQSAGQGNAGNININVTGAVTIAGYNKVPSGIFSLVSKGGIGNGGNIIISADSLSVIDGAYISSETNAQGNAGKIQINATNANSFVSISGASATKGFSSQISASTDSSSRGGDIIIKTPTFNLSNGATLNAQTRADGDSGNITVDARRVEVINGGQVLSNTYGRGNAGKITIDAADLVIVDGIDATLDERLAKLGTNIENLEEGFSGFFNTVENGASGFFARSQGSGSAGGIEVTSPKIQLDNQGRVFTDSASGNGGNIKLQVGKLLLLRRGSLISATAGTAQAGGDGGNITINTPFIIAVPKENSDIKADAFSGSGGKVKIEATGIFNIAPLSRDELITLLETDEPSQLHPGKLPTNDITAISQQSPNLSGQVTINTPDADPARGLIQLPSNLVDASQQIAQGCSPGERQTASRFISTGRGGLPLSPNEPLRGRAVITDWVNLPEQTTDKLSGEITDKQSTVSATKTTTQLVEAQGWVVDANNNVILVAQSGQSSSIPSAISCSQ